MFEIVYRCDSNLAKPRPVDAQEARARLVDGNQQFASLVKGGTDSAALHQEVIPLSPNALGISEDSTGVPRQQPFAAVLSCSDARVPIELIFHQACNDLFVVRLAGNVITNECVGSIGSAVRNLGESVKLVVVLGHTCCGAVSAAVDSYLRPSNYPGIISALGLRSIIDRIFVSVRSGAQALDRIESPKPSDGNIYRERLLQTSVLLNSAMMAMSLQQLVSEVVSVQCPVVYGVYDLRSRIVWAPDMDSDLEPWSAPRLANPPSSFDEFEALASRIASIRPI